MLFSSKFSMKCIRYLSESYMVLLTMKFTDCFIRITLCLDFYVCLGIDNSEGPFIISRTIHTCLIPSFNLIRAPDTSPLCTEMIYCNIYCSPAMLHCIKYKTMYVHGRLSNSVHIRM